VSVHDRDNCYIARQKQKSTKYASLRYNLSNIFAPNLCNSLKPHSKAIISKWRSFDAIRFPFSDTFTVLWCLFRTPFVLCYYFLHIITIPFINVSSVSQKEAHSSLGVFLLCLTATLSSFTLCNLISRLQVHHALRPEGSSHLCEKERWVHTFDVV